MELMKTANMSYEKCWRRKPLNTATFLMIMMNVFSLSLTCHPAEYLTNQGCCPRCPPGSRVKTDCTEFRSTSCLPCIGGSFMNEPTGRRHCFPCTKCDPGSGLRIKTSCTTTSDTVCEPLDGFYCTDSEKDNNNNCISAQEHTRCQPGQYIRHTGTAFTDTVCTDCSSGTFSNGTFPSCQSHTKCELLNLQLIKAGNASTDAECGPSSDTGVIVGTVVGILLTLLAIVIGVTTVCCRKRHSGPTNTSQHQEPLSPCNNGSTLLQTTDKIERRNDDDAPTQEQTLSSVRRVPG